MAQALPSRPYRRVVCAAFRGSRSQGEKGNCLVTSFTAFDAVGNLQASTQSTVGQTYTFAYTYNLTGSLVTETYPSGRVVATAYDGANRTMGLTGKLNSQQRTYVSALAYAPQGIPAGYQYGNALRRSYQYNSRLQPTQVTDQLSSSNVLLSLALGYGTTTNNGNLQSTTASYGQLNYQNFATFSENFSYDGVPINRRQRQRRLVQKLWLRFLWQHVSHGRCRRTVEWLDTHQQPVHIQQTGTLAPGTSQA